MTNFTMRMIIAAATLVAAAGAASAQDLKAEIPFAFRANGAKMQPGAYGVSFNRMAGGVPILHLYSTEGKQSALAPTQVPHDAPQDWRVAGKPVLAFECGSSSCTLVGVWSGFDRPAYRIPARNLDKNEPTHIALVTMETGKSD